MRSSSFPLHFPQGRTKCVRLCVDSEDLTGGVTRNQVCRRLRVRNETVLEKLLEFNELRCEQSRWARATRAGKRMTDGLQYRRGAAWRLEDRVSRAFNDQNGQHGPLIVARMSGGWFLATLATS